MRVFPILDDITGNIREPRMFVKESLQLRYARQTFRLGRSSHGAYDSLHVSVSSHPI